MKAVKTEVEREGLLGEIENYAHDYKMVLDWDRIHKQDNTELKNVISIIHRVYESRA